MIYSSLQSCSIQPAADGRPAGCRHETTLMTLDNDDDATPNGGVGGHCGNRGNASRSPNGCVFLPSRGGGG